MCQKILLSFYDYTQNFKRNFTHNNEYYTVLNGSRQFCENLEFKMPRKTKISKI